MRDGAEIVGRLPFLSTRKFGVNVSRMPPFTHLLGPVVTPGPGKAQTQMMRRKTIIRELIAQLPPFDHFKQHMPSSDIDGLAFQECGFRVAPLYTFTIDCRRPLEEIWDGMHSKVRQHIRRAQSRHTVEIVSDPDEFIQFYIQNLTRLGRQNKMDFGVFPSLYFECRRRDCGALLSARRLDGPSAAMIFLVWGHGAMYYLMSTRAPETADSGSVNLLIWSALRHAHEKGLAFDLDGVTSSGTSRFLSGFGGEIKTRHVVHRSSALVGAMSWARRNFLSERQVEIF